MKNLNKLITGALVTGLMLTGCNTTSYSDTSVNGVAAVQPKLTTTLLSNYNWELVSAKNADGSNITPLYSQPNKPLILTFNYVGGNNILSLRNTCNNYSSIYKINQGKVHLGQFATTMKACPSKQAMFDRVASQVVMGDYSVSAQPNSVPTLTIFSSNHKVQFKAINKN